MRNWILSRHTPVVHAAFVIAHLAVQFEILVQRNTFLVLLTYCECMVARWQSAHRVWVLLWKTGRTNWFQSDTPAQQIFSHKFCAGYGLLMLKGDTGVVIRIS